MNRFIILIIFLISCIPLATNGSPITTPKDELSIGIGAGATSSNLTFGTGFYFSPIGSLILPNFGLGLGNEVSYLSSRFIYVLGALEDTVDRISVKQSSILQTSFGLTLGKSIKFNLEMGFFRWIRRFGGYCSLRSLWFFIYAN